MDYLCEKCIFVVSNDDECITCNCQTSVGTNIQHKVGLASEWGKDNIFRFKSQNPRLSTMRLQNLQRQDEPDRFSEPGVEGDVDERVYAGVD